MRKTFFIGVLIIVFLIFILLVSFGFKLGPIKLLSYDEVEEANINKKILLSDLNSMSTDEVKNKENELSQVSLEYKNIKMNMIEKLQMVK